MKIVDNFDLIKTYMDWRNDDEYYFVQVLVRGKDGHTEKGIHGNNKNRLIKYYTIRNIDELNRYHDEIVMLCRTQNARAYIHPTKRSFKATAECILKEVPYMFLSQQYYAMKGLFSTAAGKTLLKYDKKFIVDIDDLTRDEINEVTNFINFECEPFDNKLKVCFVVPTAHGEHLVTIPFNKKRFKDRFPDIAIQDNNPTLLYFEALDVD